MAVEQKKAAFDEAKDKLEARIDNKAETEGELSEDESRAVAGGIFCFRGRMMQMFNEANKRYR